MKVVVPAMSNVMSQASGEVESMGNMLGDMMPGSIGEDFSSTESGANQETDSILQEAAAVAGTQIGEKFPSVPTSTDSIMASADSLAEL